MSFLLGGSSYGKSYTLNFDGSHNNQFPKAGAGCLIRDNEGELIVAASYNLTADTHPAYCDVAIVEALALKNGLNLAKSNNIKLNLIKGDNKEVIDHVQGCAVRAPRAPLSAIIEEIKAILYEQKIDPKSQIEKIDREANEAADKLASLGSKLISGLSSYKIYKSEDELPSSVAEIIRREKSSSSGGGGGGDDFASSIGIFGAAIAGGAMLAWGVSKLFTGDDFNDQRQNKAKSSLESAWNLLNSTRTSTSTKTKVNYNYFPNESRKKLQEFYTLNVDGLDSNQLEEGAAGCIIRDNQGDLVVAASYNLRSNCYPGGHIGIAEAMALKKGLELARDYGLKLNVVKGDNQEVINRVLGYERRPPKNRLMIEIVQEIKDLLSQLSIDPKTQLEVVSIEANKVADKLALLGRTRINEKIYTRGDGGLPFEVAYLIQQDKLAGNIV